MMEKLDGSCRFTNHIPQRPSRKFNILTYSLGSLQERHFSLMTFGIPVQLFPLTANGDLDLSHHLFWYDQRRSLERIQAEGATTIISGGSTHDQPLNRCIVPGPKDVLFGREKISQCHSGNIAYNHLIASSMDEYDRAESRHDKTNIACNIISKVQESGGRFLRLDEASWVLVDDDTARRKVTNSFRTRRRRIVAKSAKQVTQSDFSLSSDQGSNDSEIFKRKRSSMTLSVHRY